MKRNKARNERLQLARIAARAERIGIELPPEVRKELNMPKIHGRHK